MHMHMHADLFFLFQFCVAQERELGLYSLYFKNMPAQEDLLQENIQFFRVRVLILGLCARESSSFNCIGVTSDTTSDRILEYASPVAVAIYSGQSVFTHYIT